MWLPPKLGGNEMKMNSAELVNFQSQMTGQNVTASVYMCMFEMCIIL